MIPINGKRGSLQDYYPKNYGRIGIFGNAGQSYARTSHYDPQHPADDITTTVLTDGLGRLLQTKKDAEINGREWSIVSGKVKYDCFGRTVEQYHPFTEDTALYPSYNPYHDPATLTRTEYDVMDRQTYMELPTHEATTVHYGFGSWGGKTLFSTLTTDALSNSIQVLKGTMGQQIKQTAPYNTETLFEYDCLGQLKKSTDPDGFETAYDYDLFGQMTHRHHPDAGHDYYTYDPSGNMVRHTNGMGETIDYLYSYNRLTDIVFPNYPANHVHYEYGTLSHAGINAVGKVIMQEDASGWQKFEYGKLGEVTKNMRTFALPFENEPYTFDMEYEYDSYNRIQRMTYPDGEVVSYHYNYGGLLDRMEGTKGNYTYQYIDSIRYNEFEKRDAVYYGNGASIFYKYDILQRLSNIHSRTNFNEPLQNITYTYDSVGNITNILNDAGVLANGLGGQYEYQYQYDRLYRLGSSYGEWHGGPGMDYELHMDYTLNGRIASKSLVGATYIQDPYASTFIPFHYDNHYHYNNTSQPNTLSHIDNGPYQYFEWDTKGNMVFHHNDQTGFDRRLCWDEENRLQGVLDNQYLSLYQYDANGERTYKLAGWNALQNRNGSWRNYYLLDHATLYASPYLVATPQGYTKHYYAESERIASKIGGGELNSLTLNIVGDPDFFEKIAKNRTHAQKVAQDCLSAGEIGTPSVMWPLFEWKNCIEADEKDCYWYHPDHLGSSSWITYSDGKAVQHLQYMPWGEDFVNQRITDYAARYTFSAKEKDAETGYSYFGSRYYSSDLSIWLSVDPMSDKYPSLSPYVYCANNPIRLMDPNGEEVYIRGDDASAALEQLQNQTSLKLSIGEDGKLEYKGTANSNIDALITQAIDDKNITINIETSKGQSFDDGNVIKNGGGYGGNTYVDGKVSTKQYICPSILASHDNDVYDSKTGLTMVHELAESFFGGAIAMLQKKGSPDSRDNNSTYFQAHKLANYIAVGDFSHSSLFLREKPSFMSDNAAKLLGVPYIEIWKRGLK